MGICNTQEIKQLDSLRLLINAPEVCDNPGEVGKLHYIIGYCQGLFNTDDRKPEDHTNYLTNQFIKIGLPFPDSHELFLGLKPENMTTTQYLKDAAKPILEKGRVPVVITELDPAISIQEIKNICFGESIVRNNHTVLVRIILNNRTSADNIAEIFREIYHKSKTSGVMPKYWPLIQSDNFSIEDWKYLENKIGKDVWKHITIATSPVMNKEILTLLAENIAVCQFFIGKSEDINQDNQTITVNKIRCIGDDKPNEKYTYDVLQYSETIKNTLGIDIQVAIVCGQSQNWSEEENFNRLQKFIPLLGKSINIIWDRNMEEKIIKPIT